MLERARGLSAESLTALAELERSALAVDGGRLKLEWATLRARTGARVEDLLWWEDGELLGFLGCYRFGGGTLELAGVVAPAARRRGIGTALLDAAAELEPGPALLVVPAGHAAGVAFARARGAVPAHAEHALVLAAPPADGPEDPRTTLRPATPDDAPVLARLLEAAFGHPTHDLAGQLAHPDERTVVVAHDGAVVGTVRLTLADGTGGVYGFAVDPAWQGRGIGRDVLRRVSRRLFGEGAVRVGLEVETSNEGPLGLYTSLGFTRVAGEDYWALPLR